MNNHVAPAVTVSKLHIRYEHHWLFDNFNFNLLPNSWTCLLGPSGIGKTSLLRFIAGLPYDQETECRGEIIASDQHPLTGRLTYMTQQDSLLPWLNIFDNVLIGFVLRKEKVTAEIKDRAKMLLEKVGLGSVVKMKPDQLSVGMRQRAVLARTLLEDRLIILMDEPFSALDVITRLKLQELAASLLVNRTVLLVTHDPLEALRLGHQIYVINGAPAKISHVIKKSGEIPRAVTDETLLKEQGQLMKMLERE